MPFSEDPDATRLSTGTTPRNSAARFTPGTMLAGRYRIVALLGKGGMGEPLFGRPLLED